MVDVLWLDVCEKAYLCQFGGDGSPAPFLGESSISEARLLSIFWLVLPSQLLLSPFRVSPNLGVLFFSFCNQT